MSNTAKFFAIWSDDDVRRVVANAPKHAPRIVAMAKEELERRRRLQRKAKPEAVTFIRNVLFEPVRTGRNA